MRSMTSLLTLTLALGLTACPAEKDDTGTATATNQTSNTQTDPDPGTTIEPLTVTSVTDSGTTDEGMTATSTPTTTDPGMTTTEPGMTTTEPGMTTTEPGTTTESGTGSTTEPGTTTGDTTTGGPVGDESPYNECMSNDDCAMGAFCINAELTGGQVKGNFCSPACSGPGKICPKVEMGVMSQAPQCLFGADPENPTNCAVICIVGMDECGPNSDCEDIGIPPQMGATPGICTHPAG